MLKDGFSWRVGSGSSSFWFTPWVAFGRLGSLVPYVDIHDLQLLVKDVFSIGNPHTQSIHSTPPLVSDVVNNTTFRFSDSIKDAFIWTNNKNDIYTTKSDYNLLLFLRDPIITHNPSYSWSWIWKLQLSEKSNSSFGWLVTVMGRISHYSITARWVLLPHALVVASKKNLSSIAFVTVSSLVTSGTALVLTMWISSQIWMCMIGSRWVPQVHRLSFSRRVSGGLGDTATWCAWAMKLGP
jgi:hypothetical protein